MYFLLRKNASREKIVRSYYILLLLGLLLYVTRRKVTETAMNLIYYPVARGQLDHTLCMRTSWVYQMIREPFFCSSLLTFLLDWNFFSEYWWNKDSSTQWLFPSSHISKDCDDSCSQCLFTDVSELKELVNTAEQSQFPDCDLFQQLKAAVTEAERCASVAVQLVSRKHRTR